MSETSTPTRRPGRPTVAATARTRALTTRYTEDEWQALASAAQQANISVGELIREHLQPVFDGNHAKN